VTSHRRGRGLLGSIKGYFTSHGPGLTSYKYDETCTFLIEMPLQFEMFLECYALFLKQSKKFHKSSKTFPLVRGTGREHGGNLEGGFGEQEGNIGGTWREGSFQMFDVFLQRL
jgi:hypothetical protein